MSSPANHWAHIAHVPNLSGTGGVLLAAGIQFEGTEGAGEFLLDPQSTLALRQRTPSPAGKPLPGFELILEISAIEGTSRQARIAAFRRH
jgi:hypothetical protein